MESIEFTEDEKHLIAYYLRKHSRRLDTAFHYGTYILPSTLFAIYSIWKQDFVAAIVAYGALFIVAILYLSYSGQYSQSFRNILKKYDAMISAQQSK